MRKPFVVIEGVDGTGKSTVSEALVQSQEAVFYKGMSEEFRNFRDHVDDHAGDLSRLLYYFSAACFTSERVQRSLQDAPVVLHRYYASYFAIFSLNTGVPLDVIRQEVAPIWERLVKPDLTILLTATPNELKNRLTGRQEVEVLKQTDLKIVNSPEYAEKFQDTLREVLTWHGPVVEVNTMGKTPAEVIHEVEQICCDQVTGWRGEDVRSPYHTI